MSNVSVDFPTKGEVKVTARVSRWPEEKRYVLNISIEDSEGTNRIAVYVRDTNMKVIEDFAHNLLEKAKEEKADKVNA